MGRVGDISKPYARRVSRAGLTLLETLLAAVIFAVGTVSLAALFVGAERATLRNTQRLCADNFASLLIEEAVDDAKTGIVPKPDSGTFSSRTVRRGAENVIDYQYVVTVDDLPAGVRDVHVVVRWSYQQEQFEIEREVLVCPVS